MGKTGEGEEYPRGEHEGHARAWVLKTQTNSFFGLIHSFIAGQRFPSAEQATPVLVVSSVFHTATTLLLADTHQIILEHAHHVLFKLFT